VDGLLIASGGYIDRRETKSLAVRATAVTLDTRVRFSIDAMECTWTGWKSMMTSAAFWGVSR
jgi:hypothetical protein